MSLFFDYDLPEGLIAQHPPAERDSARLLVIDRAKGSWSHRTFRDLPGFLRPRDLLVVNDTKVIPARVVGVRSQTGGKWEALYLGTDAKGRWEMLAHTGGHPDNGERFAVPETPLELELVGRTDDRHWLMRPHPDEPAAEMLEKYGQVPLPPYIRKGREEAGDRGRYQTIYGEHPGSVAAPTAGLHFTPGLLGRLQGNGIGHASVTLHVGLGTFAPVKETDPTQHSIHPEWCEVPASTVEAIERTKSKNGRVVAVGTTTVRSLETAGQGGTLQPFRGETRLFLHPPYPFRVVDAMITNFHLPRTTLLLMVQAFAGTALLRAAYAAAIAERYRFYSYGDAMLIV